MVGVSVRGCGVDLEREGRFCGGGLGDGGGVVAGDFEAETVAGHGFAVGGGGGGAADVDGEAG